MPKPAKITLSIFGTIVAIIVIVGIAHPGGAVTTAAQDTAASTRATATPTATPAPTTTAAPLAADDRFVADVVDAGELLGVGHAICESIGAPGVTHASLVGELGTSKWGTAVAEVVVAAAEADLCPQRRYAAPAVPLPLVAPAPPAPAAPAAEPEPSPAPRPQPAVQQPAPRREPAREEPSSAPYFKNCAAARAAGAAPLHRGDPGYRAGLDRDDDGVACE